MVPGGFFRISEQQFKQPDHQRHGQDGKQRAQDIDRAGMRSIPVIELCHGGDCCTGGGNGRKVDRHQDGLAVREPKGCVNCPKQQDDAHGIKQPGADLLFCNSLLQPHPTPLAGHRQEKTEKMQSEYEKTDGSAEPSAKTGIISLSDTYEYAGKLF